MKIAIAFTITLFCVSVDKTNGQDFCSDYDFMVGASGCDAGNTNFFENCTQVTTANLFALPPGKTEFCDIDQSTINPTNWGTLCSSTIGFNPSMVGFIEELGFANCDAILTDCCTALATPEPTDEPTSSPTLTPSVSPTSSPTTTPSAAPSGSPTTSIPTGSPIVPTFSPTDAPTGPPTEFFADPLNIALVAGGGGGGLLLLAALAFILMRRRRSGSPPNEEQSLKTEMRGAGNAKAVSFENIFDWEKHIDKRTGEVYFFNPKTGESRWDPPELAADAVQKSI